MSIGYLDENYTTDVGNTGIFDFDSWSVRSNSSNKEGNDMRTCISWKWLNMVIFGYGSNVCIPQLAGAIPANGGFQFPRVLQNGWYL